MARRKASQAGFSLAELLVAILILAIGLLGLAEMQIAAMHDNTLSGAALGANTVAQTAIEEIMAVNPKRPQIPVNSNPLYDVVHTAGVDQDWPDIPVAVAGDYVVRAETAVPGSGTFRVTYTTDPGCPAPGGAFGAGPTFTNVTVNVVAQGGNRFGKARATLSTVKNCSM